MSRLIAAFVFRWRYPLSAICVLGAIVSIPSANITKIDNDITAWFSKTDPVYRDYERFREEFGGTRNLIVALQAASAGDLFSAPALAYIERITGDIERIDKVQRVESLATATVVDAAPDGLNVRRLIDLSRAGGPEAVRRRAVDDELIRGDLVSEDATVTALIVTFDEDRIDAVRGDVIQKIHDVVDPGLPPGIQAFYNGSLEISETYNRITLDNQRKFTPPILLVTVAAIYFTFRSLRKTVLTLIGVAVSVLWTLGLYSLLGFSYNVLASMIVPLIVILAIADDVHIMQHWDEERRHGSVEQAFINTVAHLATPLLGASGTTALGMLSLATSDVVAVRSFGIGAGVGIMVDFAISLVLMPTLLSLVKPEAHETPHERYLLPPMQRVAKWSTRRPGRVLALSVAFGLMASVGIVWLHVDTNHINFFSRNHPLGRSAAVIDSKLGGVYSYQMMLEGPPESLRQPDALARIDRLQAELRRAPHVRKVTSIADYVKRIHRELNDGRDEAAVIPGDAATIAQELFVFTLGGDGRHELERVVASDFSRAQITVKLQSMSSDLVLAEVEAADRRAKEIFAGSGISVLTTGSGRLFSTLDHYLVTSQLNSFATAFVTVFAVIFIVFRSFRFGLLTIVPNVLPVIAILGVMGYLGISMNIATVMVASVALGVVDDDTIHFINRYRREVAAGASTDEAIEISTAHEGRASLTTAIINSCGFGVLLLSEYKPTAWFGGLLALTMAVAFLAEVLILPATIKLLPGWLGAEALRKGRRAAAAAIVLLALCLPRIVSAQPSVGRPSGHVALTADYEPNRHDTMELRGRLFAEEKIEVTPALRVTASGFVEGLVASRPGAPDVLTGETRNTSIIDGVIRVHDAFAELTAGRLDVRAGFSRVVWGRLDEVQPTDVVNPLDVSRFFFEGRSEARLPVALIRGRVFLSDGAAIEAVLVPVFRCGRFDQLDEPTSPFSPITRPGEGVAVCLAIGCPTLPPVIVDDEPAAGTASAQGGVRLTATTGRVDWALSAFRGLEPFAIYELSASAPGTPLRVEGKHPRFTMIGGDAETVRGEWGIRGEVAAFVDDNFQSPALRIAEGTSFDAGAGVDRKAGSYRVSGTVLYHRERVDLPPDQRQPELRGSAEALAKADDPSRRRSDLSLVLSADRRFVRERYALRVFGLANTSEGSGFTRAIGSAELRDNLSLEGSVGWFVGGGRDLVGRFADSDFTYVRLKYYF
jgi:predicted RND superfamily exporter protein